MGLLDELSHHNAIDEGIIPREVNAENEDRPQDVNSPIWESHMSRDWQGQRSDPQSSSNVDEIEPVRVNSGQLDYMLAVSDENDELGWMAEHSTDNIGNRRPRRQKVHTPIDSYVLAATDFRTSQYGVTAISTRIIEERDDRVRAVLSNRGANPIAYSHHPIQAFTGTTGAATNTPTDSTQAAPAAGAESITVVPPGQTWNITSWAATLVTSATVGNRTVNVIIDDGNPAHILFQDVANAAQAASATVTYQGVSGVARSAAVVGGILQLDFPQGMILGPGYRIRTLTTGIQVGDQWSSALSGYTLTTAGTTLYPPNVNLILPNERIEVRAKSEIYVACAQTLTALLDVLEEYILDGRRD